MVIKGSYSCRINISTAIKEFSLKLSIWNWIYKIIIIKIYIDPLTCCARGNIWPTGNQMTFFTKLGLFGTSCPDWWEKQWGKLGQARLDRTPNTPLSPLPHRTLTSLHTFPVRSHTLETSASWEQTVKISSHLQQRLQKGMYSKGTNTVQINNMSQYKQVISFDSAARPWWRMGKQTMPFLHTHIWEAERVLYQIFPVNVWVEACLENKTEHQK